MSLLKRKKSVFRRVIVNISTKRLPSRESKSVRCDYCKFKDFGSCPIYSCSLYNHPSSQYPPRKYAYVVKEA